MRWLAAGVVLASAASAAQPLSVAVDLRGLDAAAFARVDGLSLERTATVRLVQEGFAVVAVNAAPTVSLKVRLTGEPPRLSLEAQGPGGVHSREVPLGAEALGEVHLEAVQKMVELVRAVARSREVQSPPRRLVGRTEPELLPEPPPPPSPPKLALLGVAGAWYRPGGFDPMVRGGLRYGSQAALAIELGLSGSRAHGLTVVEGQLLVGGALVRPVRRLVDLELAALVGLHLHHFELSDASVDKPVGTRADFAALIPVTLKVWPLRWLSLGVRLGVGLTGGREHVLGDQALWSRGPLWVESAFMGELRL